MELVEFVDQDPQVSAAGQACVGVWHAIVESYALSDAHNKPGNSVVARALRVGEGMRGG